MWYFAYGSNLNARAVSEWCRHYAQRSPSLKSARPAVLDNYRLCFPIFSEYWQGGVGDIVYDPGKYVAGAIFNLTEPEMQILDAKVERRLENDKEVGVYRRIEIEVTPMGKGLPPVKAVTYTGTNVEKYHIPPTQSYMDLVIQGAYQHGLSMMWISYLQTFSTQAAKKPKPPAAI